MTWPGASPPSRSCPLLAASPSSPGPCAESICSRRERIHLPRTHLIPAKRVCSRQMRTVSPSNPPGRTRPSTATRGVRPAPATRTPRTLRNRHTSRIRRAWHNRHNRRNRRNRRNRQAYAARPLAECICSRRGHIQLPRSPSIRVKRGRPRQIHVRSANAYAFDKVRARLRKAGASLSKVMARLGGGLAPLGKVVAPLGKPKCPGDARGPVKRARSRRRHVRSANAYVFVGKPRVRGGSRRAGIAKRRPLEGRWGTARPACAAQPARANSSARSARSARPARAARSAQTARAARPARIARPPRTARQPAHREQRALNP